MDKFCVYVEYYFLEKLCEEFLEDRKQMERLWRRVVSDKRPESRRGVRQFGLGLREAVGGRVRKWSESLRLCGRKQCAH